MNGDLIARRPRITAWQLSVVLTVLVGFIASPLHAQPRVTAALPDGQQIVLGDLVVDSSDGVVLTDPSTVAEAVAVSTNESEALKSPEDLRLEALLKLQFERKAPEVMAALAAQLEGSLITNDVERFEHSVLTGDWPSVGDFLDDLPDEHASQVFRHLVSRLATTAQPSGNSSGGARNQQGPATQASPALVLQDVLALAEVAPHELSEEDAKVLGRLLAALLRRGDALQPFVAELERGVGGLGGGDTEGRRLAAELLLAANRLNEAAQFLAPVEIAKEQQDWQTLAEHARHLAAEGRRERESALLEQAWEVNQFILQSSTSPATERESALNRCLTLMSSLSQELGTNWLRASFSDDPSRGLAILGAVNDVVQSGLTSSDDRRRQENLTLQKQAVSLFLDVADPRQVYWQTALNLLAQTWMLEGKWSLDRYRAPQNYNNPVYDAAGNIISYQPIPQSNRDQIRAIDPEAVLASAPDDVWMRHLEESLRLAVLRLIADLHLKTDAPDAALPFIEALSADQPQDAQRLANALLRAWATEHDPARRPTGSQRVVTSSGVVYYPSGSAVSRGSGRIALTRAMQSRNIEALSELIRQLESLEGVDLDRNALARAFSAAHSPAEVFRVADIETVFGPIEQLQHEILASLVRTMRQRLANQWRSQRLQQQYSTHRTDEEIDAEVLRGYEVVLDLVEKGLKQEPEQWELHLARANALFDLAEFQYGQKVDLEIYVEKREAAFDAYEHAASLYASSIPELSEAQQRLEVYQQWFNANLGASDLAYVTRQQEPETNELARIRNAILALPGTAAERHLAEFAASLGQRARSLPPPLKPRYLRAGLTVVHDHPRAAEARELVQYYADLLREIELVVQLDGDATVGHSRPFGVFVSLLHTAEIEREAGGFARYLRNPNRGSATYAPNPSAQQQRNFVDDFDRQVREKLLDRFEVRSITFLDEKTQSRGTDRPGWRETPLAHLLLQAQDGSVDRLPPFQMDLDFMDSSGAVVLPVQSPILMLDARPPQGMPRSLTDLEVTQILDDRGLTDGELTLEVAAAAKGLVPPLGELLATNLTGFILRSIEDMGLVVSRIDAEGEVLAAVTERNWILRFDVDEGLSAGTPFRFLTAQPEDVMLSYKRYADADLVEVDPEVALAGLVLQPRPAWPWLLLGLALVGTAIGTVILVKRRQPSEDAVDSGYSLPASDSPFALLQLLRRMQADGSLRWREADQTELTNTIQSLERYYFARERNGEPEPDLDSIGRRWVDRAVRHR